jgi:hypothetical protein
MYGFAGKRFWCYRVTVWSYRVKIMVLHTVTWVLHSQTGCSCHWVPPTVPRPEICCIDDAIACVTAIFKLAKIFAHTYTHT